MDSFGVNIYLNVSLLYNWIHSFWRVFISKKKCIIKLSQMNRFDTDMILCQMWVNYMYRYIDITENKFRYYSQIHILSVNG